MDTTSYSQPGFFSQERTQRAIADFLNRFDSIEAVDDFERERNKHIQNLLSSLKQTRSHWDKNSSISSKKWGEQFIRVLGDIRGGKSKEELDHIFAILFHFLLESNLTWDKSSMDYEDAIPFALKNSDKFDPEAKREIDWTSKQLPIEVIQKLLLGEKLERAIELGIKGIEAVDKINKWDEELDAREKRVQDLNDTLAKHETAFNFVGLYRGFNDLSKAKRCNQIALGVLVIILGLVTIGLTLAKVWLVTQNPPDPSSLGTYLIMIPSITLIVVLVYFFRVAVMEYKSVKSQLLQIELRKTLCQFIQSYCNYSKKIKAQDPEALARFEQIIFSGIVSDESRIPTAFDGLEQLIQTIKAATKP